MNTLRLSKTGVNALTSTSPNDFILALDWSTPQIIKEDAVIDSLSPTASEEYYVIDHGLNYTPMLAGGFVKFEDDRVGLIGTKAAGVEFYSTNMRVNDTQVKFGYNNLTAGDYDVKFKYLATEIPLAGTPLVTNTPGNRVILSKPLHNAIDDENPDHKIFDSQFGTLKYFNQGVSEITIAEATPAAGDTVSFETVLNTHDLGYYPYFGANFEFSVDDPGKVHTMPIMSADAGFWMYDMVYVDGSQLIYRKEFGNAFGLVTYPEQTIKIYWKIYSRDLGL